ncbi:MAG: NUDIX hydrolase [Bacteroidota bacterium]
MEIPECFYRISVKALVLNEERDKFLITKETSGEWELPGGGLDWGETPQSDLPREINEEMGLKITSMADHPSYFFTVAHATKPGLWVCNVLYETTLESLDFIPTDECIAVDWLGKDNADQFDLFPNVPLLLEQFDPRRHQ